MVSHKATSERKEDLYIQLVSYCRYLLHAATQEKGDYSFVLQHQLMGGWKGKEIWGLLKPLFSQWVDPAMAMACRAPSLFQLEGKMLPQR